MSYVPVSTISLAKWRANRSRPGILATWLYGLDTKRLGYEIQSVGFVRLASVRLLAQGSIDKGLEASERPSAYQPLAVNEKGWGAGDAVALAIANIVKHLLSLGS